MKGSRRSFSEPFHFSDIGRNMDFWLGATLLSANIWPTCYSTIRSAHRIQPAHLAASLTGRDRRYLGLESGERKYHELEKVISTFISDAAHRVLGVAGIVGFVVLALCSNRKEKLKPRSFDSIFANQKRGTPLDLHNLGNRISRPALENTPIKWTSFHGFRRGLSTNLFVLDVNAEIIAAILRHRAWRLR
jgi:hypothetical protein